MMQSMFFFGLVVFLAVASLALADEDCTAKVFHGVHCCNMEGCTALFNKDITNRCAKEHLKDVSNPTSSESRNAFACASECALSGEGLLTADHKLDKAAIIKFFAPYESVYGPVLNSNIQKCLDSHEAAVDSSLKCKSGASDFIKCFSREGFLNCPSSLWSATSECDELKANVIKCPNVKVTVISGRV